MSEMKMVKVEELIDFSITTNSGLTKGFVNNHIGNIPVYGASKDENEVSYGYIKDNLDDIKYYENCLTYNKDGSSGYMFYRKERFSLSEKVLPLVLYKKYNNYIDYEYLRWIIQTESLKKEYSFSKKALKMDLRKLEIPVPINDEGIFDIQHQIEIAKHYTLAEKYKKEILEKRNDIANFSIEKMNGYNMTEKTLEELFECNGGKSIYNKTYCNFHKGKYPVYTATVGKPMDYIDTSDYHKPYLSVSTRGNAGVVELLDGNYSVGNNRFLLIPLVENIDNLYMKYIMTAILTSKAKGNGLKSIVWSEIKKIKIPIPICTDGSFDSTAQKDIAERYIKIDCIKNEILKEIDKLLELNIEF